MIHFLVLFVLTGDFPITTELQDQCYPAIVTTDSQYCVFWQDYRYYSPDRSIFAARVALDGSVIDPDGKQILRDKAEVVDAAYDGTTMLAVIQDSC
jgi:hypothetical protein